MSSTYQLSFRGAGLVDGDDSFIISVFDASLPFLESIGSLAQWGSTPFSQRPGWMEETQQQVRDSKQSQNSDTTNALRILIAEVQVTEQATAALDLTGMDSRVSEEGHLFVSVGFAFIRENWLPTYLSAATLAQAGQIQLEESLYLEVMVSDSRTRQLFRGVGAAILQEMRNYGRSRGKQVLYLDGWAGNERKLIHYYEQQGFHIVAEFSLPRQHKEPWVGSLMKVTIQ